MKETKLYDQVKPTSIQSTIFGDGMVLNANDLKTAMLYPLELIQVLIRAYFGCGIVCGLDLNPTPESECKEGKYSVTIEPGVALDCHGFPLQLREKVTFSVLPDPCIDEKPECVCIAISRATTPSAARDCGCDENGQSQAQYARQMEGVRIKAFAVEKNKTEDSESYDCKKGCDDLPKNLCACENFNCCEDSGDITSKKPCECFKECPEPCCGESWVLIGCVKIVDEKIIVIQEPSRKYIKPIDCLCKDCDKKTNEANVAEEGKQEDATSTENA